MADGNRVYPVDEAFMHHSVGPEFVNSADWEVVNWFSNIGYSRGYNNGAINPQHTKPDGSGLSYAMAHFGLREYTLDGNKYGWRLTPLMQDVWNNVAWHCGNWSHNQRSIGIETCGDYRYKTLPEKALMLVADTFRAQDKALGGGFTIWAHKWVFATACPANIEGQIETIVDMLNNPDKWNAKLWPAPTPPPAPTKPEWEQNAVDIPQVRRYAGVGTQLVNLTNGQVVKDYPVDTPFDITRKTIVAGKTYEITAYSASKNIWNGLTNLKDSVTPAPTPTPPPSVDKGKVLADKVRAALAEYDRS